MTSFNAPNIPENIIQFAKDVAEIARKHDVSKFNLTFTPSFEQKLLNYTHGELTINFSSIDGRGRPANNLSIELATTLKMSITSTSESTN